MAGYSGTPLVKKLGVKEGFTLHLVNAPKGYPDMLSPLPDNALFHDDLTTDLDIIHFFTTNRDELARNLPRFRAAIKQNGMIWVSWPKRASKVPTNVTEGVIRELVLPLGLVDVKVCAVDKTWSGLKLVIRKEDRR